MNNKVTGSTLPYALLRLVRVLQPVILKELKQTDGDFTEDQRIELNTVRQTLIKPVVHVYHHL